MNVFIIALGCLNIIHINFKFNNFQYWSLNGLIFNIEINKQFSIFYDISILNIDLVILRRF